MTLKRVLSLGCGVQSTTLFFMSCRGILPKLDLAIFADTQYEPKAVYRHLERLKDYGAKHGVPILEITAGNIREDSLSYRQHRKSTDGKRFASIPFFVKNPDGSQGLVQRQCTKEYKIIPVEQCIRREVLGLKHRQRAPKQVVVEQWLGISSDESSRATYPGVKENKKKVVGKLLFGGLNEITIPVWRPTLWKNHVYPLLNWVMTPQRKCIETKFLPKPWGREECIAWLKKEFPDWDVPRSACICCPYRNNEEWRDMRENRPDEWADVVEYDRDLRIRDAAGLEVRTATGKVRKPIIGEVYVHRQMVPLNMVDLDGIGERGQGGCGLLRDGCGGMCGV